METKGSDVVVAAGPKTPEAHGAIESVDALKASLEAQSRGVGEALSDVSEPLVRRPEVLEALLAIGRAEGEDDRLGATCAAIDALGVDWYELRRLERLYAAEVDYQLSAERSTDRGWQLRFVQRLATSYSDGYARLSGLACLNHYRTYCVRHGVEPLLSDEAVRDAYAQVLADEAALRPPVVDATEQAKADRSEQILGQVVAILRHPAGSEQREAAVKSAMGELGLGRTHLYRAVHLYSEQANAVLAQEASASAPSV